MNQLKHWSYAGFVTILILGGLSHYVYEWSEENIFVGAFVPVNESVWEHLKMGLWAVLFFSLVEYYFVGRKMNGYFLAKLVGILVLSFTILIIYYSYNLFTGTNILVIDVASFILGALFGQLATHMLYFTPVPKYLNSSAIILILLLCAVFVIFTYYPPHYELFRDVNTNTFGIEGHP